MTNAAPDLAPATISESGGVRYLHLGTPWVQGAMRIGAPARLELEYIQRMMVWMLLRPTREMARGHAVQLGLGAGAITRYCSTVLRMRTTAVEINPSVIAACRHWFKLPRDSARLQVVEADAGRYVADAANRASADVLCVDLYDHEAAAPLLDSAEFYADCRNLLAEQGVMTVNLFGRDASFAESRDRIAAAFGNDRLVTLSPTKEGNTIVAAWLDGAFPDREELSVRADAIEQRYALPARKWLRLLQFA